MELIGGGKKRSDLEEGYEVEDEESEEDEEEDEEKEEEEETV
jgi:hypothetical protein